MLELIIFSGVAISWLIFLRCVKISPSPVFDLVEFLQKLEKFSQLLSERFNAIGIPIRQAAKAFQTLNEEFAKVKIRRL